MNKERRPLISIIIPTKNNADQLADCLETLSELSFKEKEIVVVDGNSTDNTIEILNRYSEIISNYISEPDSGVYDALNKGCLLARGRFYLFLGADDRLLNNLTDVSLHLKDPNTIYYGDVILENSKCRYDGQFSTWKLARTNICHQAIFYPYSVFNSYRYSLNYPIQADWELNMRLWHGHRYQFKYIDFPITLFGEKGLSSAREDTAFNNCYLELINKYFPKNIYIYMKSLYYMLSFIKFFLPKSLLKKINAIRFRQ